MHHGASVRRAAIFVVWLLAAPAAGSPIGFHDPGAFAAALPSPAAVPDFEDVRASTEIADGALLGGITFHYDLGGHRLLVTDAWDTTSGTRSLGATGGDYALLDGDDIRLEFAPMRAVGLSVVTSDDVLAGEIALTTRDGSVAVTAEPLGLLPDGGRVHFLGLVAPEPFRAATLAFADDGGIHFTYNLDDIVLAVPEPGTAALLAAALVGLAGLCRREVHS